MGKQQGERAAVSPQSGFPGISLTLLRIERRWDIATLRCLYEFAQGAAKPPAKA